MSCGWFLVEESVLAGAERRKALGAGLLFVIVDRMWKSTIGQVFPTDLGRKVRVINIAFAGSK
jgi:hypothetical protein